MKDLLLPLISAPAAPAPGWSPNTGEIRLRAARVRADHAAGRLVETPSLWRQRCAMYAGLYARYAEYWPRIAAVGATRQMHGTVLLDTDGEPVVDRHAVERQTRAAAVARSHQQPPQPWLELLNNPPPPPGRRSVGHAAQHHPPREHRHGVDAEGSRHSLCGVRATDYSKLPLLPDGQRPLQWSPEALRQFGLRADQLPAIHLSSEVIGQLRPQRHCYRSAAGCRW
ncbi:hypothetical protein M8494_25460 [Serratia ureilytica]